MTMIEAALMILALSLIASVAVQAVHADLTLGLRYSASARDAEKSTVMTRRLARVVRNQMEGLAMVLPLALLIAPQADPGAPTILCLAYALTRPVHGFCHAIGVSLLRSIIWIAGFVALIGAYGLWIAGTLSGAL